MIEFTASTSFETQNGYKQWLGSLAGSSGQQSVSGVSQQKQNDQQEKKSNKNSGGVDVQISEEAMRKSELDPLGKLGIDQEETNDQGLSEEEQNQISKLKTIDRKVRAHEQAHMAAGGSLVRRGASYEYTVGPDGHRYAVAGEVQIDASPESEPQATIQKAQRVRSAALAPADPSAQDYRVAAEATTMASEARTELSQQNTEEISEDVQLKTSLPNSNSTNDKNSVSNRFSGVGGYLANYARRVYQSMIQSEPSMSQVFSA